MRNVLYGMLGVLVMVVLIGAVNHQPGMCRTYPITADTDEWYATTSGNTVIVQFEPGTAGSGTGTEVTVYGCTDSSNTNSCELFYWDSDEDGVRDTSVLTGSSFPNHLRGIRIENVAGSVFFDVTTFSDAAELVICGAE